MDKKEPIHIDYYTDVLCVWAWIAQVRLEEVNRQWGTQLIVRHRYVDIFGDSHTKIPARWGEQDGFEQFAAHVRDSVAGFEHCEIHPDLWTRVRPRSSLQAHLVLRATAIVAGEAALEDLALTIRRAFFLEARDIGDLDLLLELAAKHAVDDDAIRESLRDGSALAALSADHREVVNHGVKGSPTWVLNEGRQVLYGNVGYRILGANIEELLRHPGTEASWC